MSASPQTELYRQHANAQAIRAKLWGIPPVVKKVPSLTLVMPELLADRDTKPINLGGKPKKVKPRQDANDHVFAFRLYRLQHKERRTALEHAKMICFAARENWEVLTGRSRSQHLTKLRNRIAWELRQRGLSYPQIGLILNRDHSAILHSVRKVEAEMGDRGAAKWVERKRRQSDESRERIKAERERDAA